MVAKATVPRAVDKHVFRMSYQTTKHIFTAVLVHFLCFMPPKWKKTGCTHGPWGHPMLLFCSLALLNRASLLLPIHPDWKQPLHYAGQCNTKASVCAQHQCFEKIIGGTMGLLRPRDVSCGWCNLIISGRILLFIMLAPIEHG